MAREVEVGSYLPPSPSNPAFVVFEATAKDTPALRAGNSSPLYISSFDLFLFNRETIENFDATLTFVN